MHFVDRIHSFILEIILSSPQSQQERYLFPLFYILSLTSLESETLELFFFSVSAMLLTFLHHMSHCLILPLLHIQQTFLTPSVNPNIEVYALPQIGRDHRPPLPLSYHFLHTLEPLLCTFVESSLVAPHTFIVAHTTDHTLHTDIKQGVHCTGSTTVLKLIHVL